jgi:hypothetical protein
MALLYRSVLSSSKKPTSYLDRMYCTSTCGNDLDPYISKEKDAK